MGRSRICIFTILEDRADVAARDVDFRSEVCEENISKLIPVIPKEGSELILLKSTFCFNF